MDDSMISKLSFLGAALTLFVISLGAWVRLTDAGLGSPENLFFCYFFKKVTVSLGNH